MRTLLSIMAHGAMAALVLSLGFPEPALAQNLGTAERLPHDRGVTRAGTRGAQFLEIPVGARANALAGAGAVVTRGIDGLYFNPAAAGEIETLTAGLSYTEVFQGTDIGHYFVGVVLPMLGGTAGVTVNSLNSGEIPRTSETRPSGDDTGLGHLFDFTATAVGLHYGQRITDRLVLGAAAKYIGEGIQGARTEWVGVDVGARFETGLYGTTIGGAILNIGGASRMRGNLLSANIGVAQEVFNVERGLPTHLETSAAPLPTAFQFGIAVDLTGPPQALLGADPRHHTALLLDMRDATDSDIEPILAVEYAYNGMAYLRAGKRWSNEYAANHAFSHGLAGGFGIRLTAFDRPIDLDYGYMNFGVLNHRQVVSVQVAF